FRGAPVADTIHKLVIIGSGPAGWTAAIYGARAHLSPVVYIGTPRQDPGPVLPGGQLMLTTEVENYPGFPKGVRGPELMDLFRAQAERLDVKIIEDDIKRCASSPRGKGPFPPSPDSGPPVQTRSVIIATGAQANWLGLENEMRLATTGGAVSAC